MTFGIGWYARRGRRAGVNLSSGRFPAVATTARDLFESLRHVSQQRDFWRGFAYGRRAAGTHR